MEDKKYIDLHTHTIYSDGISSPRELVTGVKLKGIDILAITDHDTIAGYEEAKVEAEKWGIALISGIEFTTKKYHILGLNFDVENKKILALIEYSKNIQKQTCEKRVELLVNYGIPISINKVESCFPASRLGRYNILMTMLLDKDCRKWVYERHSNIPAEELMRFYFKKGGIAAKIEDNQAVEISEVIKAVHNAGGIAILAHPHSDIYSLPEIDPLREKGLDGIEIQPNFYGAGYKLYEEYAIKNDMLITYGSDYHGPNFCRPLLGRDQNIASDALERILNRCAEKAVL